MTELRLRDIRKTLGETPILKGIDLHAHAGELVVLVGASGCGKSTLLRVIAGLESPDEGSVFLGERDVTLLPPKDRDVAMVFQSYALYPHLSVRENLAFGLKLRKSPRKTIDARIGEVSEMLGLGELLDRLPRQLSGGQRQRVAMGRAIARRPKLFLFDEPLSNLDAKLRNRVRVEIKSLHRSLQTTTVYVTHDQLEAMTLADRLVVLDGGKVQQVGTPLEVFDRPANRFVAGFMGSPTMNLLPRASLRNVRAPSACETVGIRPHRLRLAQGPSDDALLEASVLAVEPMGAESWVHAQVDGTLIAAGAHHASVGERRFWCAAHADLHFFDAAGERIES